MQDAEGAAQSADGARLRDVVARCAAMGSERPRAAYATRNLEQACPARLPLPAKEMYLWMSAGVMWRVTSRCKESLVFLRAPSISGVYMTPRM